MKKSELLKLAEIAVVASPTISPESKIDILRVLFDEESLEEYREEQQAKKEAAE